MNLKFYFLPFCLSVHVLFATVISEEHEPPGLSIETSVHQLKHSEAASQASMYRILNLGNLGGNAQKRILTYPKAINIKGQVVGYSLTSEGLEHAFLWEIEQGLVGLGTLGYKMSSATSINDEGIVSGYVGENAFPEYDDVPYPIMPFKRNLFIWNCSDGMQAIGEEVLYQTLVPLYIDDKENIIGRLYSTQDKIYKLFTWSSSVGINVIEFENSKTICFLGAKNKQAVGYYDDLQGRHAVLLEISNHSNTKTVNLIDHLVSHYCRATALNDKGQIVGQSFSRSKKLDSAFIWDNENGLKDIGVLGGSRSWPLAINNNGVIVGSSQVDRPNSIVEGRPHAFIWDKSAGMRDLNRYIDERSEFILLESATGINDRGIIIGYGQVITGQYCGFVMIPHSVPLKSEHK